MLVRSAVFFKWLRYAAAAAVLFLLQDAILHRITIWGVIPFLYPLLAVIPATYEGPAPGAVFALCLGVFCDALLPDQFPCLYTLAFPLAGMIAGGLSRRVLPSGISCTVAASAISFLLTDLLRCLLLWTSGKLVWSTALFLMLREYLVTLPLALPATWLFRSVHRKVHEND
jgi:rod shape-determining protein MreD